MPARLPATGDPNPSSGLSGGCPVRLFAGDDWDQELKKDQGELEGERLEFTEYRCDDRLIENCGDFWGQEVKGERMTSGG